MSHELAPYLQTAKRFPMLSAEEEARLIGRWREHGDQDALQRLVGSHLRLVIKIARQNSGYAVPIGDLIAEGNVGLLRAVDKFDSERGVRFATYAAWWIRATMREHVLHSRSLVKMGTTAAQKKLFFNLARLKSELRANESVDLPPEAVRRIAATLDVPERDVVDMNRRMAHADWSLNAPVKDEGGGEFQDLLVAGDGDPEGRIAAADELAKRRELLAQALETLSAREQEILRRRKLSDEPLTLEQLSRQYGITRERVRQIEARAIERLREKMLAGGGQTAAGGAHLAVLAA